MPRGATPIDFAYALHTDIGDTTVGAKINGQIVPLVTHLRSGDEVEIIRDQNHLPPSNWETIAATGKARAAIRRAVRLQTQQRHFAHGEHLLSMLLEREEMSLDDGEFKQLAEAVGLSGKRELLIAVGEGRVTAGDLDDKLLDVKGVKRRRRRSTCRRPTRPRAGLRSATPTCFASGCRAIPMPAPRPRRRWRSSTSTPSAWCRSRAWCRATGWWRSCAGARVSPFIPIHSDALSELYDNERGVDRRALGHRGPRGRPAPGGDVVAEPEQAGRVGADLFGDCPLPGQHP